jgi:hypothetical protein
VFGLSAYRRVGKDGGRVDRNGHAAGGSSVLPYAYILAPSLSMGRRIHASMSEPASRRRPRTRWPAAKQWRAARDAADTVVERDLGWRRRLVLSVPHGDSHPAAALDHSLLGSERKR